ncbi:hypothetical protein JCM10908_001032 [Rhodotorula pacifica]|uniref:serine/threonine-protein kinase n=1 Tax=Rhodotorula pacifica TaxID=1495444 RepID=UPI003174C36C
MESAALEALDLPDSQSQSQPWTQTQTQQTQPSQGQSQGSSRFPSDLWGILVAVTGHRTASTSDVRTATSNGGPPHKATDVNGTDGYKVPTSRGGASTAVDGGLASPAALPRPERLELVKGQNSYTVGRHPKSDLRLNGPKISSTHAKIWIEPDTGIIRLENLGTNGTYVRNSKISKGNVTILESGDPIIFGPASADFDHEFRYIFQCDPSLGSSRPSDPYGLGELSQSQSADGTSIHSFYEVREQIGKGSFAVVRKGVRRSDGMMVAIKIIQRARFAHNPKTVEMIEREVGIIQTLEHRFCVRCYDYFEDDQRIWLVLEYVDGGDLLEFVMKRRGLKESEVREIALMICEAVAYLHSRGITHRDLKPENLLLTRGEHPVCKVTDFGLAKMVDDQTRLLTMCGTPTYLAPEVILNPNPKAGYGSIVDAWSIGVVLWCCLTNQTPFDETESEPLALRMRSRQVDMAMPRSLGVSDVAIDFLQKLLNPDPRYRMSCAEALKHPWLITKGSSDAESVASIPFMCSSLPYNDPHRSTIDSTSNAGEDAVMTALTGTSPAHSSAKMDAVAHEDSGVDSQGFGKLALSDVPAPTSATTPTAPRPLRDEDQQPTSPLTGQKRKVPMSAFSDSSIDAGSSALLEPSPAKMPPPPPPMRKDIPRVKAMEAVVAESSDEPEPSTAEDDVEEPLSVAAASASSAQDEPFAAAATADVELDKQPGTPPSVTDAVEAIIAEEEKKAAATKQAARKGRPSRGGATTKKAAPTATATRGRKRPSDPPRNVASNADEEEADAEQEVADMKAKPELTGIAATVKNRRRKVAKYA